MPEDRVLTAVKTAFEPYLKTPHQSHNIRVEIARHIASLVPKQDQTPDLLTSYSIPSDITGTRRRYLKALHANLVAEEQYTQARHIIEQHNAPSAAEDNDPASVLQGYLEVLRLRKRQQQYQTLAHTVDEAELLAQEHGLFETQSRHNLPSSDHIEPTSSGLASIQTRLQERTRSLELAVLQVNFQLKRERRLLEELKARKATCEQPSAGTKLHALNATRAELTKWIEESLAKCDIGNDFHIQNSITSNGAPREMIDHNQTISEQYEKYLQARRRLVEVAQTLTAPQSTVVSDLPVQDRSGSRVPVLPRGSLELRSTLSYIDAQHLPLLDQHHMLKQSQDHINHLLAKHQQDLSQQLLRLSDESHLLPEYPVLVDSKKLNEDLNDAQRLILAWGFAMEAGDIATTATVQNQVQIGQRALNETNASLDYLEEAEEMWQTIGLT